MELFELSLTCPGCGAECRGTVPDAFQAGQMRCGACGRLLCRMRAIKGYVYVLSNPRMPGLVKVGCSTRPVDERVAELNSATAVPAPFVVEAYFASSSMGMRGFLRELRSLGRAARRGLFTGSGHRSGGSANKRSNNRLERTGYAGRSV